MLLINASSLFASGAGVSLNLDLFDTNILNLAVVISLLVWFLKGFMGGILERRRTSILAELEEAEGRLSTASSALDKAQKELADAQALAERIRTDGKARAEAIRLDSEKRTVDEMARLRQESAGELDAEAARVSEKLRRQAARMAIEKALASLPGKLDASAQARLIDQSIQKLGNS
jgi:F-type H+-transporting ATPase subunit b